MRARVRVSFFFRRYEKLIESDAEEVDHLMMDEEEVGSRLEGMKEYSNLIAVGSKESSNFLGVEDGKIGLGSTTVFKS